MGPNCLQYVILEKIRQHGQANIIYCEIQEQMLMFDFHNRNSPSSNSHEAKIVPIQS